jgi:hypothetical protein
VIKIYVGNRSVYSISSSEKLGICIYKNEIRLLTLLPYLPCACWWDIAQAKQLQQWCEIF